MRRIIAVIWLISVSVACNRHVIKAPMQPSYSFTLLGPFRVKFENSLTNQYTSRGLEIIPFHTIAANPHNLLPGTILFIPGAYGKILPGGEVHDGLFLVDEIDTTLQKNALRIFSGRTAEGKREFFSAPQSHCKVYRVLQPIRDSVLQKYKYRKMKSRQKSLADLTAAEFDTLLGKQQKTSLKLEEKIQTLSRRGKGIAYKIFLLGEGPQAKYDRDPLMDFKRFDCMTFCEHVLAATISESYTSLFDNLQRIRYKKGEISYRSRNHYTIADWLPNNNWLLTDVTSVVGGYNCREMTKIIDRRAFFENNGLAKAELEKVALPETLTVKYIPANALPAIKNRLHGGEIVSIVSSIPGIVSAHMGIIVRDEFGNILFRHASSSRDSRAVVDEYFDDYVAKIRASKSRLGMIFMRIRENVQIPKTPVRFVEKE